MSKSQEFLFIVQTAALANCARVASDPQKADQYGHRYSTSGMIEFASAAFSASGRIPEGMSAVEAASQFLRTKLDDFGDAVPKVRYEWLENM